MIALLSTSDTDLRTARSVTDGPVTWQVANPNRVPVDELEQWLGDSALVVVRLLGGKQAWEDGLNALLAGPRPVIVLTGEQMPDAELMRLSTVPAGIAAQAHAYLAHGGTHNLDQLARFLSDTVLLTGHGFDAPQPAPAWGRLADAPAPTPSDKPRVAILYYRAHEMAGNTAFVEALSQAVTDAGGVPDPIWCATLRAAEPELYDALGQADVIVATVLAAGGMVPATAGAGGDDAAWDIGVLAALDRTIMQGLVLTSTRADWEANDDGVTPLDAANQIAVPELDGRVITQADNNLRVVEIEKEKVHMQRQW